MTASCRILTWKEGMLAAVGHDLRLEVDRFELSVDSEAIRATFDLASIRCVCARRSGVDAPGVLSAEDTRQIEENTRNLVLEVKRFPTAVFASTSVDREDPEEWEIAGQLQIHGVTRSVRAIAKAVGGRRMAKVVIHQPDFGIKPFSALLGTLRVKPSIEVEISVDP